MTSMSQTEMMGWADAAAIVVIAACLAVFAFQLLRERVQDRRVLRGMLAPRGRNEDMAAAVAAMRLRAAGAVAADGPTSLELRRDAHGRPKPRRTARRPRMTPFTTGDQAGF
jgi:hypothetical protein